jgi:hypothetical protein
MKPSTTKQQKLIQKTVKRHIRLLQRMEYHKQVSRSTEKHCLKCDYCVQDYYHCPMGWRGYVCNAPIDRNPQLRIKNGFEIAKECAFYSDEIPF